MLNADLEESATLVAVTVTDCEELITAGATYNPFDRVPIEGVMDQVTAVFEFPTTVAVNCRACDAPRDAVGGVRLMLRPDTSWTVALADFEESATLVAVMVTDCELLIMAGAVYSPFDMLPTGGFTDQFTELFGLPVTVAVNCLVCDAVRVAFRGFRPTLTLPLLDVS